MADYCSLKRAAVFLTALTMAISLLTGCSLFGGKSAANYCVYVKDKELFITDFTKNGAHQLTTQLIREDRDSIVEESGSDEEAELVWKTVASYVAHNTTRLTSDGKYILYPDKWVLSEDYRSFSLYFRSLSSLDADPTKIDSNVITYLVSNDGRRVIYSKTSGDSESGYLHYLYEYSFASNEKVKIDTAKSLCMAYDGSVAYVDEDGVLYLRQPGKEADKLDKNVSAIIVPEFIPDTIKTVYYIKNDSVYKASSGHGSTRLASHVHSGDDVLQIYDDGSMYFLRFSDDTETLLDYVTDRNADHDAKYQPKDKPVSPSMYEYTSYDKYKIDYKKYEEEYDEYLNSLQEVSDIQSRNELREKLSAYTLSAKCSLYYFDGKSENLIAENVVSRYNSQKCSESNAAPAIAYFVNHEKDFVKPDLEDIDFDTLEDEVLDARRGQVETYVAAGKNSMSLDVLDPSFTQFDFSNDGNTIYYVDSPGGKDAAVGNFDMYSISVKNGSPQKPEIYDSDVGAVLCITPANKLIYIKGRGTSTDLFIDKEKIIDDFFADHYSLGTDSNEESFIFFTDYYGSGSSVDCGVLNIYADGEVSKITDEAYFIYTFNDDYQHGYDQLPSGAIIYFSDYDDKSFTGQLSIYKNGESSVIADDVEYFASIYSKETAGIHS